MVTKFALLASLGWALAGLGCDGQAASASPDAAGTNGSDGGDVTADASLTTDAGGGGNGGGNSDAGDDDCGGLRAVVRDFTTSHVDFQVYSGEGTLGIVKPMLGDDGFPELTGNFLGTMGAAQVNSEASFAQWYVDVPGVNVRREITLPLTEVEKGRFVFDSADPDNPFGGVSGFFPVDDLPGAEQSSVTGLPPDPSASQRHNFHFTTELRATFVYRGGEVFTFSGDDDVWVFANGRLSLDLGGLHPRLEGTIDFDAQASQLGLVVGETYPLDVFHAERRTNQSNFRVETTIDCFKPVVVQ